MNPVDQYLVILSNKVLVGLENYSKWQKEDVA